MHISPLSHAPCAADLPLERLAASAHLAEADKVREVCRQFEAVLLRHILAEGRKTVFRSKFNADSVPSGIYQDLVNAQLADSISRSGALGLARELEAQLSPPTRAARPAAPARPRGSGDAPEVLASTVT